MINGTTVIDKNNDMTNAAIIDAATWVKKTEIISSELKTIGKNTQIDVVVPAITGTITSDTPFRIAVKISYLPLLLRVKILSLITTELSTNIPIASINPMRESTFNVKPRK